MNSKKLLSMTSLILLSLTILFSINSCNKRDAEVSSDYIKWVDFNITSSAMSDALKIDIETYGKDVHCDWITLLSLLGAKYGGNFDHYKRKDIEFFCERLKAHENALDITSNKKLYLYYTEAYGGVLGGMVGEYTEIAVNGNGEETLETHYGLRAFSPIANGYHYMHYDDFGASRSYGYKRNHLGHDLMGSVGTPIIAVEGGYVEACGWNQYGGWRIGIRSFDGKRYYYYAHLRRDHPYNDIYEGKIVNAGEVIGYLGMTGYSAKENVNNINTPHLHYGLELIFDPSQKDGYNQIWVDMYELTKFLSRNKADVYRANGESFSKKVYVYAETPD